LARGIRRRKLRVITPAFKKKGRFKKAGSKKNMSNGSKSKKQSALKKEVSRGCGLKAHGKKSPK